MLIEFISAQSDDGCDNAFKVLVDGEVFLTFIDEESGDNLISRNFNDVLIIDQLIERVIKAKDSGESVEIKNTEVSWDDF